MKQSRAMSLLESAINIAVGLVVAILANAIILPLVGLPASARQIGVIAAFMTVVSIARSFVLRRLFEALHIRHPVSPFLQAVIAERRRQIEVEGWSAEHDDGHAPGILARAGAAYALGDGATPPPCWPWTGAWWKPTPHDPRRRLVKAAALIVAEGERFDRGRRRGPP